MIPDSKILPNVAYLHRRLDCNPRAQGATQLTWNVKHGFDSYTLRWNSVYSGRIAGCKAFKCWAVRLDGSVYRAHRLIWKMTYGEDPEGIVDHADQNPFNNRIDNLRIADFNQNSWNQGELQKEFSPNWKNKT